MYLGNPNIDDLLTFTVNTHDPTDGSASDIDGTASGPDYYVYEDETGTAILSGQMAKLDDTNTTGFYSEQLTLSAANGFENGKSYSIYIEATVNNVTGTTSRHFSVGILQRSNIVQANGNTVTATGTIDLDKLDAFGDAYNAGTIVTNVTGSLSGSVGSISGITFPTNFSDLAITVTTGRVDVALIEGSDATDQIRDAVVDDATRIDASALNTLSSHDPGATIGTSTLTQTQVTGGAYALNSASFAFNAALDLTTAQKASVNAEVDTALADINLDHLLSSAVDTDFDTTVHNDSVIGQLAHDGVGTGGGYDRTTDSLEAIRNRGDAAWVTGGGGSISDILNIQPLIPYSIDLANTATFRLGLLLFNALDDLPSTAEIDPGTISIDRKAIGATSWTAVVTDAACSESAGLIYYDEVFDTGSGYAEGDSIRITLKSQKITVSANDYEISDSTGRIFYTEIRQTMRGTDSAYTGTPPTVTQIRTEIDSNSTQLAAIVADTNELQTDWTNGGRLDLILDNMPTSVWTYTILGTAASTMLNSIYSNTLNLSTKLSTVRANYLDNLSGGAVALESTSQTILGDTNELQTDWANGGRLDLILDARASQSSVDALPTLAQILAGGDIDGYSIEEAMKIFGAALAGIVAGAATTTVTMRAMDNSKVRITATVDGDGNRSAITIDETG